MCGLFSCFLVVWYSYTLTESWQELRWTSAWECWPKKLASCEQWEDSEWYC